MSTPKMEVFNPAQVDRIREATLDEKTRARALLEREAPDLLPYIFDETS